MLILHGIERWHWAVGGLALGLITLTLLFVTNRRLGISTGFESVCSLVSKRPYFKRDALTKSPWRLYFMAGLIGGGVLSAVLAGGWAPFWDLGIFDQVVGWGSLGKLGWMFVGGLIIGLGTRLADGCTSGHGLFGLSNLDAASWLSTVAYMTAGIITTNIIYRVILGA